MESSQLDTSEREDEEEFAAGVRLIVLNLPEDEGEGLGFRLTRTLWDPYPWVREVTPGSRADSAGLRTGDCLLQADGKDLLGLPIGQVAGLIRGDGCGRGVSLLCWHCGVDPDDDPELLWSCGGAARGERARRALAGAVRALACCVCAATAARPLSCQRSHLYCDSCWARLDRCALCRETLPPKDSPYARNLVAEQVFEAIATEYEIKEQKRPRATSAYNSPSRSPVRSPARSPQPSPSAARRGQYQLSMLARRAPQGTDKCASDPNIQRSLSREQSGSGSKSCACTRSENTNIPLKLPTVNVGAPDQGAAPCASSLLQRRLVARLRQASSLADLASGQRVQSCGLEEACTGNKNHSNSMDNLKSGIGSSCDLPVFVLSPPPIYVLTCDHNN